MAYPNSYHQVIIYELTTAPAIQTNPQTTFMVYDVDVTPTNIVLRDQPAYPARDPRTIVIRPTTDPFEVTSGVYPSQGDVDVTAPKYGPTGSEYSGTLVQPAEADVLTGVAYGADGIEFLGTLTGGGASGSVLIEINTGRRFLVLGNPLLLGIS